MTHPHDFALLYDLLDGRIAPSAAEELRKRLTEEPELAAAWDELQRMREGLRALPTAPVPRGFLEGVKTRAGIETKPPVAPATEGSGGAAAEGAPAGKVFRMRPWHLAAASVAIVAGVAGFLAASRPQPGDAPVAGTETAKEADGYRKSLPDEVGGEKNVSGRLDAGRDDAERRSAAAEATPATPVAPPATANAPAPRGGEAPSGPRFGAPGGAIPPGLRQPADGPAAPRPSGAPAPSPQPPPPAPTAPLALPAPERPRVEDGEKDSLGKSQRDQTLSYVREGVDDVLVLHADTLDEARAQVSVFFFAPVTEPAGRFSDEWKQGVNPTPVFERYAGAATLLLLRGGADARVKLLDESKPKADVVAPESGLTVPRASPPRPATTPSAPPAGRAGSRSSPAGATPGSAGAVPPEAQTVLGSFFLELSPAQWTRANARIDEAIRWKALAARVPAAAKASPPEDKSSTGSKEKGEADPAKPPAGAGASPAEPDAAMGDDLAADGKAARRRVRILVLPRP